MKTPKQLRQEYTHELVVGKLRAGSSLPVNRLMQRLEATRNAVCGQLYWDCVDTWRELISRQDIEGIACYALGADEKSIYMRVVSPLSVMLTDDERREAINRSLSVPQYSASVAA